MSTNLTDPRDSDATQLGRINRNGVTSTWASPKVFPGTLLSTTTFYYDEIDVAFAPNASAAVYYEISWRNLDSPTPHLVAYQDDYLPGALGTNYLGDFGATPSVVGGTVSFQVAVQAGHSLVLAFSSTGTFGRYEYEVNAYSDPNRGENFVPEPTSLALAGVALLGLGISRRRKVVIV